MNKRIQKLSLARETLRRLDASALVRAAGGAVAPPEPEGAFTRRSRRCEHSEDTKCDDPSNWNSCQLNGCDAVVL